MAYRHFQKLSTLFFVTLLVTLVPVTVTAQRAATFDTDALVTRGDFLRATIKALRIPTSNGTEHSLPYQRVSRGFVPYVRAAHERNALGAFGQDLRLSFPITRGEAIRIAAELSGENSQKGVSYRDVRRGTLEEKAVKVAIEEGWMDPLEDNYFGLHRRLTGKQANKVINSITGLVPVSAPSTTSAPRGNNGRSSPRPISIQFNGQSLGTTVSLPKSDLLESVWRLVNSDYLYQEKIDGEAAVYKAIEALVESLDDPYSRYLKPQTSRNFQTQIQGEVSGIGAQVEQRDDIITIVTPLTGSPAEEAGLKPNDQVLAVDGESIVGLDFMEAVEKIRGERGTVVRLSINRDGITFDVNVTRDVVRVPEIDISWHQRIAVVKLMQFGKLTDTDLRGLMEQVQEQNPSGVILDLRNNPGGLLHAANVVVSNFVPQGTSVAKIESRTESRTDYTQSAPTIDENVPLIVLVNGGSASASEIVAGALQDHGRATIVGETTFGKGTVQEVLNFSDDSSLKLTVAEWFTPNGRKIDEEGVQPDIIVPFVQDRDAQFLRAVELLR